MISQRHHSVGVLIAEAVVASFLMLFAFVASAALFDAALRWESNGSNLRRAAMTADRRMEELRHWVATAGGGTTFPSDTEWATEAARIPNYPEAPGFALTVTPTDLDYAPLINTMPPITPPSGFHSPCSSLYTPPPGTLGVINPNITVPFLANNPQFNNQYESYSYSRDLSNSYKLVEVLVEYGNGLEFRLVSVLGDPMPRGGATVTVTSSGGIPGGGGGVGGTTIPGDFGREVRVGGQLVPDVSTLWSGDTDLGSGNEIGAFKRPMDAVGNDVAVEPFPGASGNHVLKASVRYLGVVYSGTSTVNAP